MAESATGFLVQQRDDGFGDVHPLLTGQRYSLGRAPDNKIVLRDDLCSRHHAEVYPDGVTWMIRDFGSLNGTTVNDEPARTPIALHPIDRIRVGRSYFLFVENLDQLPALPVGTSSNEEKVEGLEITKRLARTKFLPSVAAPIAEPAPKPDAETATIAAAPRIAASEALGVLYQLAVDMAAVQTRTELADLALNALFKATPAQVGAVLSVKEGGDLEPVSYRTRGDARATYHKVSQFVSREVLGARQAVLASDVSRDKQLRNRESLAELKASSLICAPIIHEGVTLGLIHLYRTGPQTPLNPDDLELTLATAHQLGVVWHRLRRQAGLSQENQELREQLRLESELVGRSDSLQTVEKQIARVAATRATVLVRGESGVGKELVARAIHFSSTRRDGPFVCLNCAALTETLLESELFGHEKGAFTGATERMIGKFEAANQGTIFLDEIGEMAVGTQAKLLRVLEGHPFERVGGHTPITVDVRVVAATNRPLEDEVRAGSFRKDLYFRLQVVQIDVPPLRDRVQDVSILAEHFLKRFARETGRKVKGFTPSALAKMEGYHWPGNVRELKNVIERAVALGSGNTVEEHDIWLSPLEVAPPTASYEPMSLQDLERRHILQTLDHTDWNKSKAAEILGIERSTLDRKIKGYGISR